MATAVERLPRFNSGRLHSELEEVMKVVTSTKRYATDAQEPQQFDNATENMKDIAAFLKTRASLSREISKWYKSAGPNGGELGPDEPAVNAAMDAYEVAYEKAQHL